MANNKIEMDLKRYYLSSISGENVHNWKSEYGEWEGEESAIPYIIIELAKKGLPEAIYDVAFHKKIADKYLGDVYSPDILSLFGSGPNSITTYNSFKNQLQDNTKNKSKSTDRVMAKRRAEEQIKRIEEERERIIVEGTGEYNEVTTWEYIESVILPIATDDIWQTIYDLYNRPDACVPPEDKEKFNLLYGNKFSKSNANNNIDEPKKIVKDNSSKEKYVCEKHAEDFKYFKSQLTKETDEVTANKLYTAVFFLQCNFEKDDAYSDLVKCIEKILSSVNIGTIKEVVNEMHFDKQKDFIFSVIHLLNEDLPEQWVVELKELFESSLNTMNYGLWISALDYVDRLNDYAQDKEFWMHINQGFLSSIVSTFYDCLYPESFVEFALDIIDTFSAEKDSISKKIKELWTNYLYKRLLNLPESDQMRLLRNSVDRMVSTESDYKYILESFFAVASHEVNSLADSQRKMENEKKNYKEKMLSDFVAAYKPIERIESLASKMNDSSQSSLKGFSIELIDSLYELQKGISYFSTMNWDTDITFAVNMADFSKKKIAFDPDNQIFEKNGDYKPEKGDLVELQTLGLKVGPAVKYKPIVSKIKEK